MATEADILKQYGATVSEGDVLAKYGAKVNKPAQAKTAPASTVSGAPPPAMNTVPIPAGLQQPQETNAWKSPTTGLIGQGVRDVIGGVQHMAQPGRDATYSGASRVIKGLGKAAMPAAIGAAIPGLALAPAATAAGLVTGAVGGAAGAMGAGALTEAAGGSPEAQELAQEVGGLAGGTLAGWGGSKLPARMFKVDPRVAVLRGARPVPSNEDFSENIPETLDAIKALNTPPPRYNPVTVDPYQRSIGRSVKALTGPVLDVIKPRSYEPAIVNGKFDLTAAGKKASLAHQDALEPWFQRMEGTTVSGDPIVEATRRAVGGMQNTEQRTSGLALIKDAQENYGYDFNPRVLKEKLELLNDRLKGLYSKSEANQSAALSDVPEAVLKAQRDAVAETLYQHLDPENAGAGPRAIQKMSSNIMDLTQSGARRTNAIGAEQPLTPFNKYYDPLKNKIPFLKKAGAGLPFAEGSEGRSLPLLRKAFNTADETAGANAFGNLPKPGPRQLPAPPPGYSGALPNYVGQAWAVGQQPANAPAQLGPGTMGIGVSGRTIPETTPPASRWRTGGPQTLLPPGTPQGLPRPDLNLPQQGTGSPTSPGAYRVPMGHPITPQAPVSLAQVRAFAATNDIPYEQALQVLKDAGVSFKAESFLEAPPYRPAPAASPSGLPPRLR